MAARWRPGGVGAEHSNVMRLCYDHESPTDRHCGGGRVRKTLYVMALCRSPTPQLSWLHAGTLRNVFLQCKRTTLVFLFLFFHCFCLSFGLVSSTLVQVLHCIVELKVYLLPFILAELIHHTEDHVQLYLYRSQWWPPTQRLINIPPYDGEKRKSSNPKTPSQALITRSKLSFIIET